MDWGEGIAGRLIDNLERLFSLLTATNHDGIIFMQEHLLPAGAIGH
jgi:hypothetical protein